MDKSEPKKDAEPVKSTSWATTNDKHARAATSPEFYRPDLVFVPSNGYPHLESKANRASVNLSVASMQVLSLHDRSPNLPRGSMIVDPPVMPAKNRGRAGSRSDKRHVRQSENKH